MSALMFGFTSLVHIYEKEDRPVVSVSFFGICNDSDDKITLPLCLIATLLLLLWLVSET